MDPLCRFRAGAFPLFPLLAETNWFQGLPSLVGCLFLVVVFSFLAAMIEAAFLALSTTRATAMRHSHNPMERRAGKLRLDFAKPLATMVIVNNTTNVAGSMLAGYYAADYFESLGMGPNPKMAMTIFTIALTLVVVIACEIVPKTIGENHSFAVAKYSAYPIWMLQAVLTPVVWLANLAQRPFQRIGPHPTTEEEIAQLTAIGQAQGAIEKHEGDMIHRVFNLNDVSAGDIMTPRVEMITLPADQTLDAAAEELAKINRSIVPIYGKNRDEIVGVLDRMDAFLALAKHNGKLQLDDPSIASKPFFVPTSMPADELLVKLRRRTQHLAIVVGEYGETLGLVTLEDVLEEVVGEIYDRADIEVGEGIEKISDDELLCEGAAEMKNVNRDLGLDVPNHRSVAGLLLDELERIPAKGEEHKAHGLSFRIEDANDRAILKVRIKKLPPPTEPESTEEIAARE